MSADDYLVVVAILAIALLAACVAADVVNVIGAERVARWLHLPTGEDS